MGVCFCNIDVMVASPVPTTVMDKDTGHDITTATMAQIVFEEEKCVPKLPLPELRNHPGRPNRIARRVRVAHLQPSKRPSQRLVFTVAILGVLVALPPTRSWGDSAVTRGNGVFGRGDAGIRFACPRSQSPVIKAGMAEYLKSLAIPEALVVVTERPAEGVLVYTLATPAHDTSTFNLSERPTMNILTDEVTLPIRPRN